MIFTCDSKVYSVLVSNSFFFQYVQYDASNLMIKATIDNSIHIRICYTADV